MKNLIFVAAFAAVFALSSCGNDKKEKTTDTDSVTVENKVDTTAGVVTDTSVAEKEVKTTTPPTSK